MCNTELLLFSEAEVNLRLIILTFDRYNSLKKCLDHIKLMHTEGDKIAVHIFIDKLKANSSGPEHKQPPTKKQHKTKQEKEKEKKRLEYIQQFNSDGYHKKTVEVAQSFNITNIPVYFHLRKEHVMVSG
eukprot:GHVT01058179.1.p1 GENE.GHVT01058179.1~~GHVT01058179.1.p1  ORF type:complete len:129 (+),score=9.63 GHVT01058179.1:305-691(+)